MSETNCGMPAKPFAFDTFSNIAQRFNGGLLASGRLLFGSYNFFRQTLAKKSLPERRPNMRIKRQNRRKTFKK